MAGKGSSARVRASRLDRGGLAAQPGHAFRPEVSGEPDVLISKSVNSSFHGSPDLHAWLGERGLSSIAVCGITTNHCVETTARVGGNLGYDVLMVLDACHTFDRRGPDGNVVTAEELTRATAASLHGEFATVVRTSDLIGRSVSGHGRHDQPLRRRR